MSKPNFLAGRIFTIESAEMRKLDAQVDYYKSQTIFYYAATVAVFVIAIAVFIYLVRKSRKEKK